MPRTPINLDTPGIVAAQAGAWIELRCGYCGHKAAVGPNSYGWELDQRPLRDARRLARCLSCGTRGDARVRVLSFER